MQEDKRGIHTVRDYKYHFVWMTKYHYQVLGGEVGQRCRELLRKIAISKEIIIHADSINRDHAHMMIGIPPQLLVSRAVQYLRRKSSRLLLSKSKVLRKRYWCQLWAGYWVASSVIVTDEVWKEYIENQQPPESDDDYNVV